MGWDAARSNVYINLVTQTLNFILTFTSDPNLTLNFILTFSSDPNVTLTLTITVNLALTLILP